jgi:hypothetical protein
MIVLVFSTVLVSDTSRAASANQFSSTNAAIAKAFAATASAEQSGGNITALVAELNMALNLTVQAQNLNSINSTESTLLLQNATNIAQHVSSQAISIGSAGASARQTLTDESIGGAIATVAVAALIYIYGGRLYRMFWFALYRNYLVKRVTGAGETNG